MKNINIKKNIDHKRWRRRLRDKLYNSSLRLIGKNEKSVRLPENFSFQENRKGVLSTIGELEKLLDEGHDLYVNCTAVVEIDLVAMTLLLAIVSEFKAFNRKIQGNFPKDEIVKSRFLKSGFFKILFGYKDKAYGGNETDITTHGRNRYDIDFIDKFIAKMTMGVFGEEKRSSGVRSLLSEAMTNTGTHADPTPNAKPYWWLVKSIDTVNNRAVITFVDYGVGVIKSLRAKNEEFEGYSLLEKWRKLGFQDHTIMEKIFSGSFEKVSRTREEGRGQGLYSMVQSLKNEYISKLVIMTNNAYCDVLSNTYINMEKGFSGTLIQFEVVDTCRSLDIKWKKSDIQ